MEAQWPEVVHIHAQHLSVLSKHQGGCHHCKVSTLSEVQYVVLVSVASMIVLMCISVMLSLKILE